MPHLLDTAPVVAKVILFTVILMPNMGGGTRMFVETERHPDMAACLNAAAATRKRGIANGFVRAQCLR